MVEVDAPLKPARLGARSAALRERVLAALDAEPARGWRELVPAKAELLQAQDALEIDEVLAICYWGRSGSRLLTSFLDHHEQVLMLPMEESQRIYEFLVVHPDLPLRERLLAYPFHVESYTPIFGGEFPIEPAHYYAAVEALVEAHRDQPEAVLRAHRTFFQFLHVAYSLAIGRRLAVRRPLIVYAQHRLNYHTARLMADFPKARFVHTVRDPISAFDSTFAFYLKNAIEKQQVERAAYPEAAVRTLVEMAATDCPNRAMDERTRAIRFEDLHLHTEGVMRALADWIGIPYRPSLVQSSYNGIEWTVTSGGKTWSGARPGQALRRAPNLWPSDRALVHALFHEDFLAWGYEHPQVFGHAGLRRLIGAALWIVPTRVELLNGAPATKSKLGPALARADGAAALAVLKGLWAGHVEFVRRARAEIAARTAAARPLLTPLEPQ